MEHWLFGLERIDSWLLLSRGAAFRIFFPPRRRCAEKELGGLQAARQHSWIVVPAGSSFQLDRRENPVLLLRGSQNKNTLPLTLPWDSPSLKRRLVFQGSQLGHSKAAKPTSCVGP